MRIIIMNIISSILVEYIVNFRSRSASPISRLFLLLIVREPLRHRSAVLKISKETLVLTQAIVVEYSSPFFIAKSSASLL